MKQPHALGSLFGASAIVMMVSSPVWAAATQITGVTVNASGGGVQVLLDTQGGERPQVFTVNRGTDVVADIINTQLSLPGGQSFRQNNPAPGIASVVVTPLDANSVRVIVSGSSSAPQVQINRAEASGIDLGFLSGAGVAAVPDGNVSVPPPPPAPGVNQPPAIGQRPDVLVPNPEITIEGGPAPIARPNQAPPFLPRAVAPPVGDIAVGNVDSSASIITLGTTEVIPRLVLRDAPVRDVLALLARAAGFNIAYAPSAPADPGGQARELDEEGGPKISLDIENEPIESIFNYVLRIAGLEANLVANTVFVGARLPDAARNVVIRTLRLNQVPALEAANFLVAQGAERQDIETQTQVQTVSQGEGLPPRLIETVDTDFQRLSPQLPEQEGLPRNRLGAPYLLTGVLVTIDDRMNSVTLVGEPRKIEIAAALLSQIDLRQRQVAVNVKIIDVNLSNVDDFSSSFSFGINDSFFVVDGGAAAVNFGGFNPPSRANVTGSALVPPIIANPVQADIQFDRNEQIRVPLTAPQGGGLFLRPIPGVSDDPLDVRVSDYEVFEVNDDGTIEVGNAEFSLPTLFRYPQKFLSLLQAQVQSRNAKILTDPTLVVQEGSLARVNLTQDVLQSVEVTFNDTPAGVRETRSPTLAPVGLTLTIEVENIDDNGFVTLELNPEVSSPVGREPTGEGGFVTLVQRRTLSSGQLRLRDGQTLIVSGIIQDQDRTTVSKVPILGDLPLIGSLFRSTNRTNERAEVIVLVTPQILDDSDSAGYGYGYVPGQEAQQLLRNR